MFSKIKSLAGQGESHGADSNEQSLTTILTTAEDRTSLLLLIANSIESMRTQVSNIFDAEKINETQPLKLQSDQAGDDIKVSTSKDQSAIKPDEQPSVQPEQKKAEDDAKKSYEQRLKELAQPSVVDLKQAALGHFDDWREKVIQRVGEAVNQPDSHEETPQPPKSGHTSRNEPHPEQPRSTRLQVLYPPQETPLRNLEEFKRILILHSLLLLLLGLETYTAESRVLMLRVASSLSLSEKILADDETSVAKGLLGAAKQHMNADEETKNKIEEHSAARKWKVGLGAAAGAVLIGVTGGLAAPLLAAGVGTVMGGIGLGATATAGYLGALAGSAPLVGVLFGAYGARMTGQMIDEYAKQVEDFAFVPINKPSLLRGKGSDKSSRSLRVAIAISGWLTEESEVVQPWRVISGRGTEAFSLRWELKALISLGNSITTYVQSYAWSWAKKEIISRTIFATLSSALSLPYGLAKAARVVDNPFSVARSRSEKAGAVLADALINKVQGERPVTLIGYSLGARVIYTCLTELANRKAFGLVESVCLVGAPVPSDPLAWRKIRSVVAGRVVNVYSTKDYLLAFLYRTSSLQYGIGGLQAIEDVQGIENFDVSELVDGHTQYRFLIGSILEQVGLEDIDHEVLEKQMKLYQRKEQEAKEKRDKKEAEGKSAEEEADEMEKEVDQKNKATQAMDWVSSKVSGLKPSGPKPEAESTEEEKLKAAEKQTA